MRLVKGAYWDTEIKRAQTLGLGDFPVFTAKLHTDLNYMRCVQLLRDCQDCIYPAFASHNAMTLAYVSELFAGADYELQRLHGMGEGAHDALVALFPPPRPVRVYAPVGTHRDLLAYLVRRLLENGANSSFVHQFSDPDVTAEQLAVDPRSVASAASSNIATGLGLYDPVRRNSRGYDLGEPGVPEALAAAIGAARRGDRVAAPIVGGVARQGASEPVRNPATGALVGHVIEADAAVVADAVTAARAAQGNWSLAGGAFRAERLERAADLLEDSATRFSSASRSTRRARRWSTPLPRCARRSIFCAMACGASARGLYLSCRAAGPDGRTQRADARRQGRLRLASARGTSRLRSSSGQVSAALAAGNSVLAKPAEQTPLIAHARGRAAARSRHSRRCACVSSRAAAKPWAPR